METNTNQNLLNKDPAARLLINSITDKQIDLKLNGSFLYHEFPLFLTNENQPVTANVLIISPRHGIVVFKCDDVKILGRDKAKGLYEEIDQVYSQIYSRLVRSKLLRENRTSLLIGIKTFLFLPNLDNEELKKVEKYNQDILVITNASLLVRYMNEIYLDKSLGDQIIKETVSILEGSKGIIKPRQRSLENLEEGSKADILEKIEAEIATFDAEQKRAALYIVDGPQRIRGLAGSGKTIVLAMKAALIHLREPEAEILYTFFTKSLYAFIKRLITRFYREYSERDPDWEKIHILHAWGGKNLPGVYYNACVKNNITPITLKEVQSEKQAFDKVCEELCKNDLKVMYDYSLLDEGQDFPIFFYRLCRKITKNNRVIWGYDECQNILNIDMQDTKQTFGIDDKGQFLVDFSKAKDDSPCDIVLYKCYRNPRKVLVYAFALGLGIYNDRILQLPENNELWKDLGFEVKEGNSEKNDKMVITRPDENSPLMKNTYLEGEETVTIKICKDMQDEVKYLIDRIGEDLKQGLLPEEILVISLDDFNVRRYFSVIADALASKHISSFNLLEAPFDNKDFYLSKHVTLTTVYRAKGNEAASVYILGVDAIFINKNSIRERNKLFTAMTRTKAWISISGVGEAAKFCEDEIKKISKDYPNFKFTMPDRKQLKIFQRDLTDRQEKINKFHREVDKLANELGISKNKLMEEVLKPKKISK